ncbi:RING finger protein narya-like [Rhagoletis pomonella]|uniref:RING finger protein narya-like n=1 Tax=Rhagoletis pomonella TaxID=28610 RepID=UPI0017855B09|nr:RING finger protein narya-like [Rhagoletis pomonella]
MFMVNCNRCFRPKTVENPNRFFIAKCSHIFCQECLPNRQCHVCNALYDAKAIDANMPKAMAEYFDRPEKAFRKFQKILQFQISQDALNAHYWVNFMPLQVQEETRKLKGMLRIYTHLDDKLAHETKRIEKLKAYISYKKQSFKELSQGHLRPGRGRSSAIPSCRRYRTESESIKSPTISTLSDVTLSSGNCTRSTDLSKHSDPFSDRGRRDFTM